MILSARAALTLLAVLTPLSLTRVSSNSIAQESTIVDEEVRSPVDFGRVEKDIADAVEDGFRDKIDFPGKDLLGDFAPAVPILIPLKLFTDLKQSSQESGGDLLGLENAQTQSSLTFTNAGYFAYVEYDAYTISIQASAVAYRAPSGAARPPAPAAKPDYVAREGNNLRFGYVGVDYLVLFECKVGDADCITPEIVDTLLQDEMVLCDRGGECVDYFPVKQSEQP